MLKDSESLKQKYGGIKIVILGFAREGVDTLRFLRKLFPQQVFGLADQKELSSFKAEARELVAKDQNLKLHFGKDYLKALKNYDVVIKSPGIPFKTIKSSLAKKQELTSSTKIFFDNCPGKIIGVTGTKGKSTTASLTYQVLKSGGLRTFLVGNIGQPVLSLLFKAKPEDIYVYELSSHQLADLKKSPQISVFLNLYPEHLDYYRNFNEYFKAKQNICRYQNKTDFFLFNPVNKYVSKTARISKARKIALNPQKAKISLGKHGRSDLPQKLLGEFNLLNMAVAIEIGKIFKIPESKIIQTLKSFKPLPHRLEFVGQYQKIKFYNDSLATIPQATIEALTALGDEVETIFLGGFDRGLEFKELAKKIIASNLKTLIFFPGTGKRIWREITKIKPKNRFFNHFFIDPERNYINKMSDSGCSVKNRRENKFCSKEVSNGAGIMERGVNLAFKHTDPGKICLLSCASPSFGIFRDYRDRGDQFKKYVRQYKK